MFIYKTSCVDPAFNLATEEYFVKTRKYDEPILFLWQNDNTIVVGRNQNAAWEINLQNAQKDSVNIVRRNSGGGTVFHDLGNMNFSIIYTDINNTAVSLFSTMLEPVISTLNKLGVPAKFSGRNDIELNGKKISGNAMWKYEDRFLQHGTILFNSNLDKLTNYLTVDRAKILSKNIKSIAARVTNVNSEVEEKIDIQSFMDQLIETYKGLNEINTIELSQEEIDEIKSLSESKFKNSDWNYAKNADFDYRNKQRLEGKGSVEVLLRIEQGVIKGAKFYGDFLGFEGTEEVEQNLIEVKYETFALQKALENSNIKAIFGENFTTQDILDLLIQ
ncbi:lipoate--protein ligase [Spiroplasma diminutum]|uniref:lipoate--protein ligase n=1 Tax=Spiroplasma diminutum CUAS-1 TaxID=1276221 RepID=S5M357_9MOLU|nr:lipoate--protein ligase [Spiroplasma diminutum]AGR42497.1 lipoate protein ligase A [Spiroplasma diminutum CUAS-1]